MDPLISPRDLRSLGGEALLLDARPLADYAAGHLTGALHADLEAHLSTAAAPGHDPARGGRHPLPTPEAWGRTLGAWGLRPGRPVVVYDASQGGNAAARAWWMLRAAGVADSAVLDGGLQAALAEGFAPATEVPVPVPAAPWPCNAWALPLADAEAVAQRLADPAWVVLDARSAERWRGEVEPFDPVPGRLPGSRNLPWPSHLGPEGRLRSPAELRALFDDLLGGVPPERLIVHCGSGVTACHTLLALEAAGLPGAALYVGSWSEWCRGGRPRGGGA